MAFFFTPVNSLTHGPVNVKVLLHAVYKPLYILLNLQLQIPKVPREHLKKPLAHYVFRAQELCESRGGHPGLPVPNKPTFSVDVKQHSTIKFFPHL